VWPENFSTNSAMRVWAAKVAARHPALAVVDLSSFKCGHDAPTYGIVDAILAASDTPVLRLHDLDANRPSTSMAIRLRTFDYTLRRHLERRGTRRARPVSVPQDVPAPPNVVPLRRVAERAAARGRHAARGG